MNRFESRHDALDEELSLQAYDAAWPKQFVAERDRLLALFPEALIDLEHIGSTAVPGLLAEPVLDLMAGVESGVLARSLAGPLHEAGYSPAAVFNAALTERQCFARWRDGRRTQHLHIVVQGSPTWRAYLRFRDALRASPVLAAQYAALKAKLVLRHPNDRAACIRGKSGFVQSVLAQA